MEDTRIFQDKSATQTAEDLITALGPTLLYWKHLREYVMDGHPVGKLNGTNLLENACIRSTIVAVKSIAVKIG